MQAKPRKSRHPLELWLSMGGCDADVTKEKAAESIKERNKQAAAGATEAEDAVEVQLCPAIRSLLCRCRHL